MTPSVPSVPSGSSSGPAASARPEGSSVDPSVDTTAQKAYQFKAGLSDEKESFRFNSDELSISAEKDPNTKKKERKIGGQKIKEITAKKPGEKKPVDVSPTDWKTLTKVTDKAKERFWPEKHWKKALYSPVSIFAGAGLALAHGARTITHGVKHLKANISKDSKLPPLLHNLNPFRAQDFVELTEDEKDKFCEKMDEAWKSHQKTYNEGKEENKKILSEDVVRWGFEIPKKKDGRFGFRIVYRIPDKNGRYVKGQNKDRKYKVDKAGIFEYKMKYLFWGKLDLDDLDNFFVESTSIVEDWENITENDTKRVRVTAKTLGNLKKAVKEHNIKSEETKAKETAKQNCWLHTTVQRILHNKEITAALSDLTTLEATYNFKLSTYTSSSPSSEKDKTALKKLKDRTKKIIECIKDCIGQTAADQHSTIEEKYAGEIRRELGFEAHSQEDSDDAYKVLESYLQEIDAIEVAQITETIKDSTSEQEIPYYSSILIPAEKDQSLDLTESINKYFSDKESTPKDDDAIDIKGSRHLKIPKKPPAITIEINNKATLNTIPLNLKYEDEKFVADEKGEFEFNYASIHEGDRGGGHYFSIYKKDDEYFIYDNTKVPDPEKSIDIEDVKKYLEHAKTIVYEQTTVDSHGAKSPS
ncbi:MAG: hypothetical protein K1060chlam3_00228 [Candidatus Anoxychlamydiales bacterium]|nr:hypothetical protein [Candidatus Anoxychlamydiales bacterium]